MRTELFVFSQYLKTGFKKFIDKYAFIICLVRTFCELLRVTQPYVLMSPVFFKCYKINKLKIGLTI